MAKYHEVMATGEAEYRDVLDALRNQGHKAFFTQTGGMNAAIEVTLERGMLLVTDSDEPLPWSRRAQAGWGVGYYRTTDCSEGPVAFSDSNDKSLPALTQAINACLTEATQSLR